MKLTLTSTDRVVQVERDGASVPGRVWEGTTDTGIAVSCVITRIAVRRDDADLSQFQAELAEQSPAPAVHVDAFPHRLIL